MVAYRYWDEQRRRSSCLPMLSFNGNPVFRVDDPLFGISDSVKNPGGRPNAGSLSPGQFIENSFRQYTTLSMDAIVSSRNPIIRALGMLDSRLGQRRLSKINVKHEHEYVRCSYLARCRAERMQIVETPQTITAVAMANYVKKEVFARPEVNHADILAKRKRSADMRAIIGDLLGRPAAVLVEQNSPLIISLQTAFITSRDRAGLVESLMWLQTSTKLVNEFHGPGLLAILSDREHWIRPLSSWKVRTHNADRQFASLLRHLYARFHVPAFLDKVWLSSNRMHQEWFKHIGDGRNIRKAVGWPETMTKMMAHNFLSAPEHYSIVAALRWGQIIAEGGNRRIADAVVQTRICDTSLDDEFWLTVFRFFARNPMLDPACIGPIIDYIWNQKYENVLVFTAPGVVENRGPAQPNFSMKGRSVQSLMAQVERWHLGLGKRKAGLDLQWNKSAISNFEFIEGTPQSRNMKIWRIFELLSSKELVAESRQMKHCVSTYAQSCYRGDSTIWSMTLQTAEETRKVLTIEVTPRVMHIRQVRGLMNRLPNQNENQIIGRWAIKEGLK